MSTIKTIDVNVSGLNPNNKYRFKFTNNGGNWPVRVTPLSGVFYPSNVKTYVYFCSTTGDCPASDANVFFNTPQTHISDPGLALGPKSLYSVLGLSITEYDNLNEIIYTHPCIVECDECVPQLSSRTDSASLTRSDGSSVSIMSEINGLIPGQSYTYSFQGAGGNWPTKIVPRSGTIKASNEYVTITNLVSLCSSSDACLEADNNVLNYIDTSDSIEREDIYSVINLVINPVNETLQKTSTSSFSILCDDCLPKTHVSLPPVIDLNPGDTFSSFDVSLVSLNCITAWLWFSKLILATVNNVAWPLLWNTTVPLCGVNEISGDAEINRYVWLSPGIALLTLTDNSFVPEQQPTGRVSTGPPENATT